MRGIWQLFSRGVISFFFSRLELDHPLSHCTMITNALCQPNPIKHKHSYLPQFQPRLDHAQDWTKMIM